MTDHWTPPLSEEGSEEVLREQDERPAETPARIAMLTRVRDAVRSLGGQGTVQSPQSEAPRPDR